MAMTSSQFRTMAECENALCRHVFRIEKMWDLNGKIFCDECFKAMILVVVPSAPLGTEGTCRWCGTRGDHYCPEDVAVGPCPTCDRERCICEEE